MEGGADSLSVMPRVSGNSRAKKECVVNHYRITEFGKRLGLFLCVITIIVLVDVFLLTNFTSLGYSIRRKTTTVAQVASPDGTNYPAPYVGFSGFRGPTYKTTESSQIKIAFFGGSTGYRGTPPVAKVIEHQLEKQLSETVFVENYSVVSSHHRQHLHQLIELLPHIKPDLVVFYGGYNETIQSGYYDPRPGYPYNYFYHSETDPLHKVLLRNSAILGEIDKKFGIFTPLQNLRKENPPFSEVWSNKIVNKYFETLSLTNKIVTNLESERFGKARFLAFYQPNAVMREDYVLNMTERIRDEIRDLNYAFDVSTIYDNLEDVYPPGDIVHVNQAARKLMGEAIADIVINQISKYAVNDVLHRRAIQSQQQ
jgi:hypothetical protein